MYLQAATGFVVVRKIIKKPLSPPQGPVVQTPPCSLGRRASIRALSLRHIISPHTMSSTPAVAAPAASTAAPAKKELPQLLPLEEDDEFEEFPSEGALVVWFQAAVQVLTHSVPVSHPSPVAAIDWDDKDTFAASLDKGAAAEKGTGSAGLDSLWEDSWDDDDVGDDFSVQLR